MLDGVQIDEAADHAGQAAQRRGKDDGHDTGHIHLDGNVAGLAAVHFTADHPLGVLDGDAALGVGQDDHEHHRHQSQNHQQRQEHIEHGFAGLSAGQNVGNRAVNAGPTGHDAGEDQQRQAVADALLVDLVAQPAAQLCAGSEAEDDDHRAEDAIKTGGVLQSAHVADDEVVADGQHQAEARTHIVGDAQQLAAAFLTFLGEVLQIRDGHGEQLDDDGSVDGGLHTQSEQGAFAEGAAAHHVEVGQHAAGGKHTGQRAGGDIRNRNGTTKPEQNEDHQREQKALAQILHLPCFAEGFQHLTSPQPSRPLSQFFPSRRQCRLQPGRSEPWSARRCPGP